MKKFLLLPLALIVIAAPLAGCNQNNNKAPAVKERAMRGALRGAGGALRGTGRGHHGLRRACGSELQQYCAGTDRGRARRECLQNHITQLSADCKSALEARGRGRHRRDSGDDTE